MLKIFINSVILYSLDLSILILVIFVIYLYIRKFVNLGNLMPTTKGTFLFRGNYLLAHRKSMLKLL